jgi:hypothetical protein
MGCTASTQLSVSPPSPLPVDTLDAKSLQAVTVVTPSSTVNEAEAAPPAFVRSILNHDRLLSDEYELKHQIGK